MSELIAVGMSETTLNTILSEVYSALHPALLKGRININKLGVSSVDFDFKSSPLVSLQENDEAKAFIKAMHNEQEDKDLHDILSSATFTTSISNVMFTINYTNGATPTVISKASMDAHATVTINGTDSELGAKVLKVSVNIPDNEIVNHLLDNAVLPFLVDYLNTKIFHSVHIPPIAFKSLKISTPLPVIRNSHLTAFSSLGATPSKIPPSLPWPDDGVYIAINKPAIEALFGLYFPLGPHDSFKWNIFSGHVGATINRPNVERINSDGSIQASIEANASCQLEMEVFWPINKISLGPNATAIVTCTFKSVIENGEMKWIPDLPIIVFEFDFGLLRGWINDLLLPLKKGLSAAMNAALNPIIAQAIPPIPVCSIPPIPIHVGGYKFEVQIDEGKTSCIDDSFLVINAKPTVTKQSRAAMMLATLTSPLKILTSPLKAISSYYYNY